MDTIKKFISQNKTKVFYATAVACLAVNMTYFFNIWCVDSTDTWSNIGIVLLKVLLMFNIILAEYLYQTGPNIVGKTITTIAWVSIYLIPILLITTLSKNPTSINSFWISALFAAALRFWQANQ